MRENSRKPAPTDLAFPINEEEPQGSPVAAPFPQTTANENDVSVAGGSFLTRSLGLWLSPRKNARKSSAMDVKESGPSVPSSPRQEKKRRQSDKVCLLCWFYRLM